MFIHTQSRVRAARAALALALLMGTTPVARAQAPVAIDPNNRYLSYDGITQPLIGMSSEFLPHVDRTAAPEALDHCVYSNYASCIDNLALHGLNKMQVWLSLNSSVGIVDRNCSSTANECAQACLVNNANAKNPYDYEQPFFFNGSRWRLNRFESIFFSRLNEVIAYARIKNVIVEVVLFADSGQYCTSPWYPTGRNLVVVNSVTKNDVYFTDRKYFTSMDQNTGVAGVTVDRDIRNQEARGYQLDLVAHAVQQLSGNPNLYWQIANEPDQTPMVDSAAGALDIEALINWHHLIAKKIYDTESAMVPVKRHPIGVNFWSKPALDKVVLDGRLDPYVQIVNGHYVALIPKSAAGTPNQPLYGAIPTVPKYFAPAGSATMIRKVFGFNETKSTPIPSVASARAEAWEYMLSSGAVYDNYNLDYQDPNTHRVLRYLNFLQQFLEPLTLTNFGRPTCATPPGCPSPAWASGLPTYPTNPNGGDGAGLGNTYWSSMLWSQNQYALYIHHSFIPDPLGNDSLFKSYAPCYKAAGYAAHGLDLSLGSQPGWYKAEWFVPSETAPGTTIQPVCTQSINWGGSGSPRVRVTSPKYPYDLALRVMRCPDGAGACTTNVSCSTVPVAPLPPHDERSEQLANCSPGS